MPSEQKVSLFEVAFEALLMALPASLSFSMVLANSFYFGRFLT
jgi:hypothetical protein